jgi:hydrogenase maturation factor
MLVFVQAVKVLIRIKLERFAIIVINTYVRVVKIMNNSQENQMINGFFVARIVLRIELVRLQWMQKAGKSE